MKKILFISGTIGVGKTTLGFYLQEKLDNCIFIDVDTLCFWSKNIRFSQMEDLVFDNLSCILKNYQLSECIDTIIIAWVFDKEKTKKVINCITQPIEKHFFLLSGSEQTIRHHLSTKDIAKEQLAFILKRSMQLKETLVDEAYTEITVDGQTIDEIYTDIVSRIQ